MQVPRDTRPVFNADEAQPQTRLSKVHLLRATDRASVDELSMRAGLLYIPTTAAHIRRPLDDAADDGGELPADVGDTGITPVEARI